VFCLPENSLEKESSPHSIYRQQSIDLATENTEKRKSNIKMQNATAAGKGCINLSGEVVTITYYTDQGHPGIGHFQAAPGGIAG